MIGTSFTEYLFIRSCIFALRAIPHLSALYLGVVSWKGTFIPFSWIGWYALAEYAFFTLVYLPRRRILQKPAKHPALYLSQRQALIQKCLNPAEDPQLPSGWFHGRLLSTIKRDNYVEWLYWAIFSTSHDSEEAQEYVEEVEQYLKYKEDVDGQSLEPGHDADVKPIKVTLDPVVTTHRPLIWYFTVGFIDMVTSLKLHYTGFQHYAPRKLLAAFPPRPLTIFTRTSPTQDFSYWYRPHRSTTKLPIIFIHGIGIGLWPYVKFLQNLAEQDPDVGIIAIEILPISCRITRPPPDSQATCKGIEKILDSHKWDKFVVVSHSYGTAITAYMLRSTTLSLRISATLLVDPINFLLHHPSVAYNFLYRTPKSANEWQLWYFASRDPDIARTLSRHFFWYECILWKEDLVGKKFAVVLSEKDQIVDAKSVRKYLTNAEETRWQSEELEVLWYPSLDHATVFDTEERIKPLLSTLDRFTTY